VRPSVLMDPGKIDFRVLVEVTTDAAIAQPLTLVFADFFVHIQFIFTLCCLPTLR